jgi:peptidoglycan L-alanyl-D-glutamate endopeptidase CwlK
MPSFSNTSLKKLLTCHPDIVKVIQSAINYTDFTVLYGHRTQAEQLELYKKGRELPGAKVTNCDGYKIKSKHNSEPSLAIDIAPYPIDWKDIGRFYALADIVLREATLLGVRLKWGGNWEMKDFPHFEI